MPNDVARCRLGSVTTAWRKQELRGNQEFRRSFPYSDGRTKGIRSCTVPRPEPDCKGLSVVEAVVTASASPGRLRRRPGAIDRRLESTPDPGIRARETSKPSSVICVRSWSPLRRAGAAHRELCPTTRTVEQSTWHTSRCHDPHSGRAANERRAGNAPEPSFARAGELQRCQRASALTIEGISPLRGDLACRNPPTPAEHDHERSQIASVDRRER